MISGTPSVQSGQRSLIESDPMTKRIEMTIKMQLTEPQALAMQAMMEHWNQLASQGSSRMIAYFVDGDGNFKPNTTWQYSEPIQPLTDEMRKAAIVDNRAGEAKFDFDPIAWILRKQNEPVKVFLDQLQQLKALK
jgi:hypothetical protein